MLTVKLMKGHVTKIIEATEVNIYPAHKGDDGRMDNKIREVAGTKYDGNSFAFFVAEDSRHDGFADTVEFYKCAYIENAHGATTEKVYAY